MEKPTQRKLVKLSLRGALEECGGTILKQVKSRQVIHALGQVGREEDPYSDPMVNLARNPKEKIAEKKILV
jgi:hypothetical protein